METARERWKDRSLGDAERLLYYLQERVGEVVCLRELRSRLGFENIRGRIDNLRTCGYGIDGAHELALCTCDGEPWGCYGSQLYRLVQAEPVRPARIKLHGGDWYSDNWEGLVVHSHTYGVADLLTEVEQAIVAQHVREAIKRAENEICVRRGFEKSWPEDDK